MKLRISDAHEDLITPSDDICHGELTYVQQTEDDSSTGDIHS